MAKHAAPRPRRDYLTGTAFAFSLAGCAVVGAGLGSLAVPDTAPSYDDVTGEASCPLGTVLYDTENPDYGDSGVVCRAAILAL